MSSSQITPGALEGVRILDFTHVYQGPVCTQLLADFGAEVIKVERPGMGDWSRQWGPFVTDVSLPFAGLNRNKRSLALNLKDDRGLQIMHKLVTQSDVLVHNFRPGAMEKLGLGYDDASRLNPRLVYATSSGWGDAGPYVDRRRGGHDMMARATSGLFDGVDDRGMPAPAGISADYVAGLLLGQAILIALLARERTGDGQCVTTDLLSAGFHANTWNGTQQLNPDRIDADLTAQIEKSDALVNLVITSKFPAEEFHLGIFQEVGTIRGNKGRDTFLFRVKPKDVRMLARKYWIEKIALAPPMKF